MEPRSNSMRLGAHFRERWRRRSTSPTRVVFLARRNCRGTRESRADRGGVPCVADADALIAKLRTIARAGDHVVFMSMVVSIARELLRALHSAD